MTRSPRRNDPPVPHGARKHRGEADPERDADPTERFSRADERNPQTPEADGPPAEGDASELAATQALPRANAEDFDEDLIRTRELPATGDDWLQEVLDTGNRGEARAAMSSRPPRESTGHFAHPASGTRSTGAPRRASSSQVVAPAAAGTGHDDTEARIAEAYRKYFALCKERAQAVVGEAVFAQRLRERLSRLAERHPRNEIEFRPVVDDGVVRVRVLLARVRAKRGGP